MPPPNHDLYLPKITALANPQLLFGGWRCGCVPCVSYGYIRRNSGVPRICIMRSEHEKRPRLDAIKMQFSIAYD